MNHKMMPRLPRRAAFTLSAAALAACTTPPKPKIPGVQTPVMPVTQALAASPDAPAVTLPSPVPRTDWPQLLAGPAHAPGNIAGPSGFGRAWHADIGTPGGDRQPLIASPVSAGGLVYTMDADANVSAFSLQSGERRWRTSTRPKHVTVINLGGGIGYDASGASPILYASTGYSEILALDAGSGKILWRQPLDFPARSAPTIGGGIVAVNIQNDLLLTFDPVSGEPGWRYTGRVSSISTSVALAGAPAIDSGIVVAGFSSGTLAALDVNSGMPFWEQSLASAFGQASDLDFSDISGAPVVAGGVAYAASLGQTMMAVDLRSGAKVWTIDASGSEAFCAAGGFVFVLDTNCSLAAIHADDGLICWTLQLPLFKNPKKKSGAKSWSGPVMINNGLVLTSTLGDIITVDPVAGKISSHAKLAGPADVPPIVVGGTLLQLTRNGILTAYS